MNLSIFMMLLTFSLSSMMIEGQPGGTYLPYNYSIVASQKVVGITSMKSFLTLFVLQISLSKLVPPAPSAENVKLETATVTNNVVVACCVPTLIRSS
jgi:hypothetical protein